MKESTAPRLALPFLLAGAIAMGLSACKPEQSGTDAGASGSSDPASAIDPGTAMTPGTAQINATQGEGAVDPNAATFGVAGLTLPRPEGWTMATPGPMRAAELRHPGNDDAIIVFTHFGERGAGTVPDNLTRWARQVVDADNQPTLPDLTEERRNGLKITIARHAGTYLSGTPGTAPTPQLGTVFLGAIIEGGPRGTVYARAHGPSSFITEREAAIREMFLGARAAE